MLARNDFDEEFELEEEEKSYPEYKLSKKERILFDSYGIDPEKDKIFQEGFADEGLEEDKFKNDCIGQLSILESALAKEIAEGMCGNVNSELVEREYNGDYKNPNEKNAHIRLYRSRKRR